MKNTAEAKVKRGFTLIELLVVIAIIAILAAILFPVFARARENARRTSCTSNVKQIMLGVMQYTQDYDERVPILISTDYTLGGNPGRAMPWFHRIMPYVKSTQLFQCPSDSNTAMRLQDAVLAVDRFPISYAANIYSTVGVGGSLNVSGRSLAEFANPATTAYLSDAGARSAGVSGVALDANGKPVLEKPGCPLLSAPFASSATGTDNNWCAPNPRHLDTGIVGFFDGHVKAMKPEKWYYSITDPLLGSKTPWMDPVLSGN